jgi:uncharacterized RDD family membrane protein YckC
MNNSKSETNLQYVGFPQRFIAFVLDFIIIGIYILFLLGVGIGINAMSGGIALLASPIAMNILAFITIIMPVVLYSSLQESSTYHATLGKRWVKIKVVNLQGTRLSAWQTFLRSAIKFLPWQLAHMSVIYLRFGYNSPIFMIEALISQGLVIVYIVFLLFVKRHQTPYDLISGTYVVIA